MHELGVTHGSRTKLIAPLIAEACKKVGATDDQARACGEKFEQVFIKKNEQKKSKKAKDKEESAVNDDVATSQEKSDTLLFLSPRDTAMIAEAFAEKGFVPEDVITKDDSKKQAKEVAGLFSDYVGTTDALDIALFGRMVAQAADLNVDAAASFSHAISTHKVSNEVEFFTALDDQAEEPGSAHIGSLEFNSATYYRYISLDLGQLWANLSGEAIPEAVEAFTKALFIAVPSARQTTQSGASPWEFARIYIRRGQRLQVPFETAVKARNGGYLQESIDALTSYLSKKEALSGSLFMKEKEFTFGEDENFSIDNLVHDLRAYAVGAL